MTPRTMCALLAAVAAGTFMYVGCDSPNSSNDPSDGPAYVQDTTAPVWCNAGWKGLKAYDMPTQSAIYEYSPSGTSPDPIVADNGYVFVGFHDGTVRRSSNDTLALTATITPNESDPQSISNLVAADGRLWAGERATSRVSNVYQIDPDAMTLLQTVAVVPTGGKILGMTLTDSHLWVLEGDTLRAYAVNLTSGAIEATLGLGTDPENPDQRGAFPGSGDIASTDSDVWVVDRSTSTIFRINPGTLDVTESADLSTVVGERVRIAANATTLYAGNASDTSSICEMAADLGSTKACWTYAGNLSFFEARGSRMVAVLATGSNHDIVEINPAAMDTRYVIKGGTIYSYGIAIE